MRSLVVPVCPSFCTLSSLPHCLAYGLIRPDTEAWRIPHHSHSCIRSNPYNKPIILHIIWWFHFSDQILIDLEIFYECLESAYMIGPLVRGNCQWASSPTCLEAGAGGRKDLGSISKTISFPVLVDTACPSGVRGGRELLRAGGECKRGFGVISWEAWMLAPVTRQYLALSWNGDLRSWEPFVFLISLFTIDREEYLKSIPLTLPSPFHLEDSRCWWFLLMPENPLPTVCQAHDKGQTS